MKSFRFLLFHRHEITIELVEAALPELALPAEPILGELQPVGSELVSAHPACLLRAYKAVLLEHLEMLDEGRERHAIGLGELAHRGPANAQALKHIAPRRVGQGPKD